MSVDLVTEQNFESVIEVYCLRVLKAHEEQKQREWGEWVKRKYLERVEKDYPKSLDNRKLKLKNVVTSGRLTEICHRVFEEQTHPPKKKRCSCWF